MTRDQPVRVALDVCWDALGDRASLLGQLAADAVLARARSGERRAAMPRIVELMVAHDPSSTDLAYEIGAFLDGPECKPADRSVLLAVLDRWWTQTLMFEAPDPSRSASTVLSLLVRTGVAPIRWLEPWLTDLDGPAAVHFADLVLGGLDSADWSDLTDLREQVRAWARGEPAVMGITLVGGVHLDDGVLSDVLDRLLSAPSDGAGLSTQ